MDPVEITAGRLHLRPWSSYDEDVLLAGSQDPLVQRWTTVPVPYTAAHARARVADAAAGWERGENEGEQSKDGDGLGASPGLL